MYRFTFAVTVTTIPYFQYPRKELQIKAMIKDRKWFVEIPVTQTNSCEKVQSFVLYFLNNIPDNLHTSFFLKRK